MWKILRWALLVISVLAIYLGLLTFGPTLLSLGKVKIEDANAITEILQSITETIAIIVAGIWTYNRFIKTKEETREDYPYPKIQHKIEHYNVGNGLIYLSVFVAVTNEGKRKLDLREGEIFIRQVSPLPEKIKKRIGELKEENKIKEIQKGQDSQLFIDAGQRLRLDTLGDRKWKQLREIMWELEPGQTREIQFNFIFGSDVNVIEAISYFNYENSGWELATLYPLKKQNTKITSSKGLQSSSHEITSARSTR